MFINLSEKIYLIDEFYFLWWIKLMKYNFAWAINVKYLKSSLRVACPAGHKYKYPHHSGQEKCLKSVFFESVNQNKLSVTLV